MKENRVLGNNNIDIRKVRIIPRLDVKGANVVKGIHLEGLRVLGIPEKFALAYYQDHADEILFMDSVASLYGRNNLHEIVTRAAEQIFIPMTVGGGIRTIEDVKALLKAGADKVAINTALFSEPKLVKQVSEHFGSQCMVVSIDVVQNEDGKYECLTDNGRERTGVDLYEWVDNVVSLGAGEILLTSVDNEGTGNGYDIDLVKSVAEAIPIPVIACGGAGKKEDIHTVITDGKADAVSAASIFHYDLIGRIDDEKQNEEGNKDFLSRAKSVLTDQRRKGISPIAIHDLKVFLNENNISTRIV